MTAATCTATGKTPHPSPQAAHSALGHLSRRKGGARPTSSDVYRCQECHGWHVRSRGLAPAGRGRRR